MYLVVVGGGRAFYKAVGVVGSTLRI